MTRSRSLPVVVMPSASRAKYHQRQRWQRRRRPEIGYRQPSRAFVRLGLITFGTVPASTFVAEIIVPFDMACQIDTSQLQGCVVPNEIIGLGVCEASTEQSKCPVDIDTRVFVDAQRGVDSRELP